MEENKELIHTHTEMDGIDYIICAICGKKTKQITHAHLQTHKITFQEYIDQFPDRLYRCESLQKKMIENQCKSQYDNEKNKCKVCGKLIKWNQTYCSTSCAGAIRRSPLVPRFCLNCGTNFYTSTFSFQKFCCRTCYDEFRNNQSKQKDYINLTKQKYGNLCALCDSFTNLRVHHIDEDHQNNEEKNLILLCESCHRKIHNGTFFTIYRTLHIEVSHQLPQNITCNYIHGHTMIITIGVKGKLNLATGMVMDFKELAKILKVEIENKFDHSFLNDYFQIPTAEICSFYIFKRLKEIGLNVQIVRIHETAKNYVEFKG